MKKLLVCTSTFPRWKNDSVPPHVYELSKRLAKEFDVTVLAPHYPGAKRSEMMDGIKVARFKYFFEPLETLACSGGILPALKKNKLYYLLVPFFIISAYYALKKLASQQKFDIIQAHWTIPQGFLAALIKRQLNIPLVITAHGADIFALRALASLKRFALKNADRITAASSTLKNEILHLNPKLKVDVIPMGVDQQKFHSGRKDAGVRKKYGIRGPFLLFVGRLAEKKGIPHLIQAMPRVIQHNPAAKLLIVGTGFEENSLKKLTRQLGMQEHIIFAGGIPHRGLPSYYASADLFISPSITAQGGDREGTPVTIMEALSSGTPVIASGIKNSEQGITLVDKLTPETLADAILAALLTRSRLRPNTAHDWDKKSLAYAAILKASSSATKPKSPDSTQRNSPV